MDDFYAMVRKWTVRDYWTPGVKAEVILDMLLSEFVEDIVRRQLGIDAKLIAKEFPIRRLDGESEGGDNSARNAKVDFLLADRGKPVIYLTELKTTEESLDREQLKRMARAAAGTAAGLFAFYERVQESVQNRIGADSDALLETLLPSEYEKISAKTKLKYRKQWWQMLGNPVLTEKTEEKELSNILSREYAGLKSRGKIEIIYLMLNPVEQFEAMAASIQKDCPGAAIHKCVIQDYSVDGAESGLSESQRALWKECVFPILDECMNEKPKISMYEVREH